MKTCAPVRKTDASDAGRLNLKISHGHTQHPETAKVSTGAHANAEKSCIYSSGVRTPWKRSDQPVPTVLATENEGHGSYHRPHSES